MEHTDSTPSVQMRGFNFPREQLIVQTSAPRHKALNSFRVWLSHSSWGAMLSDKNTEKAPNQDDQQGKVFLGLACRHCSQGSAKGTLWDGQSPAEGIPLLSDGTSLPHKPCREHSQAPESFSFDLTVLSLQILTAYN